MLSLPNQRISHLMTKKKSLSHDNYTPNKTPTLKAINPKARNGEATLYFKGKHGPTKIKTVSIDKDGYWKTRLPKEQEGKTSYAIRYTDQAGNTTGKSSYFTIIRDFTDPLFTPALPTSLTLSKGQKIDFPAEDTLSGVLYYKVNLANERGHIVRSWRKQKDSFYIVPLSIPAGRYTLSVKAFDRAGNISSHSIPLLYGITPISVTPPASSKDLTVSPSPETPIIEKPIVEQTPSVVEERSNESVSTPEVTGNTPTPSQETADTTPSVHWWNPLSWF